MTKGLVRYLCTCFTCEGIFEVWDVGKPEANTWVQCPHCGTDQVRNLEWDRVVVK
jgi:DNA-directed RNA polymerase subunit RPC12/RpoP